MQISQNGSQHAQKVQTPAFPGKKKRNEILQMSVLEPSMCILDETDSGLDVDAMKIVADGVNKLKDEIDHF